jgi:peptide/nickel transport system substrate-binding protein
VDVAALSPRDRPGLRGLRASLALVLVLGACRGESALLSDPVALSPEAWAELPPDAFCREALRRVEWFLGPEGDPSPQAQARAQARTRPQSRPESIPPATPPQRPADRFGGTAVVGGFQELRDGLNGLLGTHYRSVQHQHHVGLMTLLRRDRALGPEPWLAASWELSDDGTALRFTLRDDVAWHDGTPVTAADVAFTFFRASDPEVGAPRAELFEGYRPGESGVEILDDRNLTFRVRPHVGVLDPWLTFPILPAHLLGAVPPQELRSHPFGLRCPVGNGPFAFVEHRQDDRWIFRANPAFPAALGGRPYLDRYVYRVVPDATTLLSEILTGGVDLYPRSSPEQARVMEADPEIEVLSTPGTSYVYVAWNSRRPQLADARVRRALGLAMDRPGILHGIREGRGRLAGTGVPPYHPAWVEPPTTALAHDPELARRLLDDAGWRMRGAARVDAAGRPLRIVLLHDAGSREQGDIALRIQAMLSGVGVTVDIRALELGTLLDRAESPSRDFDALIMSTQPDFRLDDRMLFHSRHREEGPYAWAGIQDPELDSLLDALAATDDPGVTAPLWARYQERVLELQPYTWLYFPDWLTGVRRRLRDVQVDVRGEWAGIQDWWIPAAERR